MMQHPSFLDELEAEAIYVIREAYAQFERPAILFSGGKDSIVVSHLARKAFAPAGIPFALVHVDTGQRLDLGDVRESARVILNGQPVATAWSLPLVFGGGRYLVARSADEAA